MMKPENGDQGLIAGAIPLISRNGLIHRRGPAVRRYAVAETKKGASASDAPGNWMLERLVAGAARIGGATRPAAGGWTEVTGATAAWPKIGGRTTRAAGWGPAGTEIRRATIGTKIRGRPTWTARGPAAAATTARAARPTRRRTIEIGRRPVRWRAEVARSRAIAGAGLVVGVGGGIGLALFGDLRGEGVDGMERGLGSGLGGSGVSLGADIRVSGERGGAQQQAGDEGEFGFGLHGGRELGRPDLTTFLLRHDVVQRGK